MSNTPFVKANVRIGGAALIGVVVVLGAFYARTQYGSSAQTASGIVSVGDHTALADANSNGVPDWKENLGTRAFNEITLPTTTPNTSTASSSSPETFTDKFSKAFFQDYLEGKISGQDFSNPQDFVTKAAASIEQNTGSKMYSVNDVVVVPNSTDAERAYGNHIGEIIQTYSVQNSNELGILQKALTENDPKILDKLTPIADAYQQFLDNTLLVPTPQSLVQEQIALLDAYHAILTDIKAMQIAFKDPLYSYARVKRYEDDARGLLFVFTSINTKFTADGIVFDVHEGGSVITNLFKK